MKTTNSLKINKSNVMKRAWFYFKKGNFNTFGEALKNSWQVEKQNIVTYNIDTLYKKYHSEIFNYVSYKLNGNSFDAQDITSEVFIKINQNIYLFDSKKSSIKTWIYNITNNTIKDFFRSKNASKRNVNQTTYLSDFQKDNGEDWLDIVNPETSNELENSELGASISNAITQLKPIEQKLVNLILIQGYKYKEVSDMLDINLNTVKVTINRIKTKLATELKQVYELHQ